MHFVKLIPMDKKTQALESLALNGEISWGRFSITHIFCPGTETHPNYLSSLLMFESKLSNFAKINAKSTYWCT